MQQIIGDLKDYIELSEVCAESMLDLQSHLWCVTYLEEDIKDISKRLNYIKLCSEDMPKNFELLLQSFQHLPNVLECSAWLKEMLVVLRMEVIVNSEADIDIVLLRVMVCVFFVIVKYLFMILYYMNYLFCFLSNALCMMKEQ